MVISSQLLSISFILYIILAVFLFRNGFSVQSKVLQGLYIFLSILGGIFLIMLILFSRQPSNTINQGGFLTYENLFILFINLCYVLVVTIFLVGIIMAILYTNQKLTGVSSGILFVVNLILFLGILTFIASLIKNTKYFQKEKTIFNLIIQIIFYIPCLLVGFIDFLKNEYKITTKTSLIILGFDILFILLKVYLPIISNYFFKVNGKQLLKNPIYLNKKKDIGNFEDFKNKNISDLKFKYNYAISCWIYINPQPPNTNQNYNQFTSIFNYSGKPNITYQGNNNTLKINLLQEDGDIEIYKTNDFLLQKWNNIIINYSGGTLDIFINGNLVVSKKSIIPYMAVDKITTGETNGIEGGICNIQYFSKKLDINEINKIYNSAKNKNPPI